MPVRQRAGNHRVPGRVGAVLYHMDIAARHQNLPQDDTVTDSDSRHTPEGSASSSKSRVDREIEEILSRSENVLPLPPPESRPRRPSIQKPPEAASPSLSDLTARWGPRVLAAPILLALGAALMSVVIAGSSPLLANLFAFIAVFFVLYPIIQRFRRPSAAPETRMWRGRVIDPRLDQPSPISQIKQWWSSQRR